MSRAGGLGRGLSALIPAAGPGQSGLMMVPLHAITPNPRQPRGVFDEDGLEELAHSLREVGMLQPILVRALEDEGRYEIIAGERRYRAARIAGLEEIPAILRHTEDEALLTEALVENLHRTDLNPLEQAAAYHQLIEDFDLTHDALAERLGKSRPSITNTLRLLTLAPEVQHKVASGLLTAGHARALLSVDDPDQQRALAQRIAAEGLSVRATEELVRRLVEGGDPASQLGELAAAAKRRHASPYAHLQDRLTDALATRVQIKGNQRRGRVIIDYAGREDLERLLDILSRGTGADLAND